MSHPTVHPVTPRVALACGCTLGEAPVWDARTGTLLFVDVKNPGIWRYQPASGFSSRIEMPERVGFVLLTPDDDMVVAGLKSGLTLVHLFGGQHRLLLAPEPDQPGNRLNDGTVGPDGRLYFGTMDDGETKPTGRFYVWDGDSLLPFGEPCAVTNGPAVGPDGRTLYTVDSHARTIYVHDLKDGVPGERRLFVRFEEGWGQPDGLAVDAEGHVWACHFGDSRVSRFAPDGTIERIVPIPTAQVTKCAFGGPDLTTLYVTTAAINRDPHIDPMAGHLFVVETGIRGQPSCLFSEVRPA